MNSQAFTTASILLGFDLCRLACRGSRAAELPTAHVLIAVSTAKVNFPLGGQKEVALDRQRVVEMFKANIAPEQLNLVVLPEEKVLPDKILETIENWPSPVKPDDAFVFYYCGHGNYDKDRDELFFRMFTGTFANRVKADLSRAEVREKIKALRPHHLILLTDCCANFSKLSTRPHQGSMQAHSEGGTTRLFEFLLFDHKGVTDITSSEKGEESGFFKGSDGGGIFTQKFVDLANRRKTTLISWRGIHQEVGEKVREAFPLAYPDGLDRVDGKGVQMTQNVYAISLGRGPVLGARAQQGGDGLFVTEVVLGAPADLAKIQTGDSIVTINNKAIRTEKEYSDAVDHSPNLMQITVRRTDGRKENLTVQLDR